MICIVVGRPGVGLIFLPGANLAPMFTGIVEELGEIVGKEDLPDAARFGIRGPWSPPTQVTATRSRSTVSV